MDKAVKESYIKSIRHVINELQKMLTVFPENLAIVNLAVHTLERRIPVEPKEIEDEYVYKYYCPSCGVYFGMRGKHSSFLRPKPRFCNICGQAIDWEDVK